MKLVIGLLASFMLTSLAAPAMAAPAGASQPAVGTPSYPANPGLNGGYSPRETAFGAPLTPMEKGHLLTVGREVDGLIDQHKCDEASAVALRDGNAKMADIAARICALRYAKAE
ncbi:MAG: hypothetical protein PW843_06305 [Azospirillaceae bacterium]|nr:hypothetical protein [Azospirillaceae bacterium]